MRRWKDVASELREAARWVMKQDDPNRDAIAGLLLEAADNGDDLLDSVILENPGVENERE